MYFQKVPISIILVSGIIFCYSCQETETYDLNPEFEVIRIDPDHEQTAEAAINTIVYLESTENSIIGEIGRVQLYDERIYVFDMRQAETLFLFDKEGSFIKRVPKGKGPGEVLRPRAFYIDQANREVYLWDPGLKRMSTFDSELNHLSSSVLEHMIIRHFEKLRDGTWLVCRREGLPGTGPRDPKFTFFHYDEAFDQIYSHILPLPIAMKNFILSNPISREIEQIPLFANQFDRNIYTINEAGEVTIRYTLDFGEYNILENDLHTPMGYEYPFSLSQEGKRVISINQLINTEEYFAFSYVLRMQWQYVIYSKKRKQYWLSTHLTQTGALPKGKLMAAAGNGFVLVCEPDDYNTFCESSPHAPEICEKVSTDSNPILVLFNITL